MRVATSKGRKFETVPMRTQNGTSCVVPRKIWRCLGGKAIIPPVKLLKELRTRKDTLKDAPIQ